MANLKKEDYSQEEILSMKEFGKMIEFMGKEN